MLNFSYKNNTKLIFGKNSIDKLEDELKKYNSKVLMLISGNGKYLKDLGIYNKVKENCEKLNIKLIYNNEVIPNPEVELVRKLVDICKKESVDFILAAGGGSVMDTAKAVAVGALSDEDVWEFYLYNKIPEKALNIGVISTLPASGSEASNCSIISNGKYKLGLETDLITPEFAILDPEYTKTLPLYQTSVGICDISSHLIERYYSVVKNTDTTDYMIEGLLKALIINGLKLIKNPDNIDARAEVFLISIFAHNNILDSGRMADWASHRIEHELSGEYGITHGEGMAVVLVAYTKYMAKKKPEKLAQLVNRVFGIDSFDYSLTEMAEILADKLEDFYKKLHLRTKLSEMNINDTDFEKMADRATKNGSNKIGHYLPLGKEEIIEILNIAR
ncbi:iron-containing alcohol dehydrogenase [Pseudoleptotrichia goodfellowii]|uniref:Alcohol dehydrogenase, iron-dependent n=1 Tax=Pseudoleptotrichia goodfellowii F0264 TaxID=596323 RepID=D0GJ40_9FUSO|nr:iron-containing alcohol dehydrogenase [Pseudoleptotrichia goodfellowii]EEY35891.1 alcohol dehydrogenase, iron-dependent [Pseudoleptotrichia goodfellowii F0264]